VVQNGACAKDCCGTRASGKNKIAATAAIAIARIAFSIFLLMEAALYMVSTRLTCALSMVFQRH
jgi:hypothetical protein